MCNLDISVCKFVLLLRVHKVDFCMFFENNNYLATIQCSTVVQRAEFLVFHPLSGCGVRKAEGQPSIQSPRLHGMFKTCCTGVRAVRDSSIQNPEASGSTPQRSSMSLVSENSHTCPCNFCSGRLILTVDTYETERMFLQH